MPRRTDCRETANILTAEGVRGEYNIVGYLAREFVQKDSKYDVRTGFSVLVK